MEKKIILLIIAAICYVGFCWVMPIMKNKTKKGNIDWKLACVFVCIQHAALGLIILLNNLIKWLMD